MLHILSYLYCQTNINITVINMLKYWFKVEQSFPYQYIYNDYT